MRLLHLLLKQLVEVGRFVRENSHMSSYLNRAGNFLSFTPVVFALFDFSFLIFRQVIAVLVIRLLFITTALRLHSNVVPLIIVVAYCGVETFEHNVSELALHEGLVDVRENTRWFRLNNTDVVYAA